MAVRRRFPRRPKTPTIARATDEAVRAIDYFAQLTAQRPQETTLCAAIFVAYIGMLGIRLARQRVAD